jgi:hypothetical protein
MNKVLLSVICSLACVIFWAGGAWGEALPIETCVSDATELQNALTTVRTNGYHNLIKVVEGTYTGHFTYSSSQGTNIILYGGYTAACASRTVNPTNTIIDGGGTVGVLDIYDSNGGNITVDGFTVQHGGGASTYYGAGVYAHTRNDAETGNMNAGSITITNNIFSENTGVYSGAVYADSYSLHGSGGNITVSNNVISNNNGSMYGAGLYVGSSAGAGSAGAVTISSNTITGNTLSDGNGGGIYVSSYSASSTGGAITLSNNTITGNSGKEGGGVFAYTTATSGTGGAVTITNNIITGNTVSSSSGGVDVYSSANSGGTGGTVTITNNTIAGNTSAGSAGGLYLTRYGNTINIYNNIIRGNAATSAGDDIYLAGSTGTFNGYNNDYHEMNGTWDNSGSNIDVDPLFVGGSNYHLSATSPCFGAGDGSAPGAPSTDFEGDSRTHSVGTLDMGADEYYCANYPFNIGGTISSYASIHAAYEAMSSGDILLIHSLENTENLAFDIDKTVTLKGGYGCGFSSNPGYTRVKGSLTISSGKVTVENIKIK